MNRIFIKWALLLCLILQFPSALSQEREKWIVGHGDLSVPYINGQFIWNIWEGEEIRNTIVGLGPGAKLSVPNLESFTFLGEPGTPVWIAPMVEDLSLIHI